MMTDKPRHDQIFKKSMENPYVAQEFLTTYLPKDILKAIDTKTLKLEKDSFVEDNLSNSFSDILFSCKFNNQDGYIYLLLEAQSTPDHFMAFRLFKYMINICDRYLTINYKTKKLPVVYPLVLYHGAKEYNAPLNVWNLFNDPEAIKTLWTNDYPLINVNDIPDEELKKNIWAGLLLFFLKHIHERQLLKKWQEIADLLPKLTQVSLGYDHIRNLLRYSLIFIDQDDKMELEKMLITSLSKKKEGELMVSIAQNWINEGMAKGKNEGIIQGIKLGKEEGKAEGKAEGEAKGRAEGEAKGRAEERTEVARNLKKAGVSSELISQSTGLTKEQIDKL